jgi:hypothetical protein
MSLDAYIKAENRFEKSLVVHSIVDNIKSAGGRFLKRDSNTKKWYELSDQQAKEKVGHAVRDAVNSYEGRKNKSRPSGSSIKSSPAYHQPFDYGSSDEALSLSTSLQHSFASFSPNAYTPIDAQASNHYHAYTQTFHSMAAESNDNFLDQINDVLGPMNPNEDDPIQRLLARNDENPNNRDNYNYSHDNTGGSGSGSGSGSNNNNNNNRSHSL